MSYAYWAYDFTSERTLTDILAVFNEAEPWQWELRDSAWYGEYLNSRPIAGVRLRVHEYPQGNEMGGMFVGLHDKGFSALLQIEENSSATRHEVDNAFRKLLEKIDAQQVTNIEPYD